MLVAQSIKLSKVIATLLIAVCHVSVAMADDAHQELSGMIVLAQTSMGAPDPMSQGTPSAPASSYPPADYAPRVTPSIPSQPNQPQSIPSNETSWGAIGFTADGSYSSIWKMNSQAEAEAAVAKKCAEYGRGACRVVSFSGQECVALATFIGPYKRRRWALSFTAGGTTYPEAQRAAINSCNSDERSQGRCQPRMTACADGR